MLKNETASAALFANQRKTIVLNRQLKYARVKLFREKANTYIILSDMAFMKTVIYPHTSIIKVCQYSLWKLTQETCIGFRSLLVQFSMHFVYIGIIDKEMSSIFDVITIRFIYLVIVLKEIKNMYLLCFKANRELIFDIYLQLMICHMFQIKFISR